MLKTRAVLPKNEGWLEVVLPTDFLKYTHTNGTWIKPSDIQWMDGNFRLKETLNYMKKNYQLYKTIVTHFKTSFNIRC